METPVRTPRLVARIEQDTNGIVTGWNDEAERLLGWPAAEAIGMRSHMVIPPRNRKRHDDELRLILASADDRVFERDITASHRDGHELQVRVTIARQRAAGGDRLVARVTSIARRARAIEAFSQPDRYRAILDQIEDGCCVVDLRGNYLYVNDAFCRMFNYDKHQITGTNFKDSTGLDRVKKLRHVYTEVYQSGQPIKAFEYEVFPKDRAPMFIEQSVSLERDEQGNPIGFLSIARDCTARKNTERALEDARTAAEHARVAAENANRAKSDFLANMSHEIRTPMNGIIGMTELALDTELTPYQSDCINTVKESAESLLTILNDILDFSKIESRKLDLESVPFRLLTVIDDALKPLVGRANQKGLELIVDIAPETPVSLVGDPGRLRQIVMNLVGNAVKFTERGHVAVSVAADSRTGKSVALHFQVADTGIGIARDKVRAIFDPFTQADGSTTRRFGGTGLGLTISSTLVQMMGGRIWVESEPGAGSVFHFTAAVDLGETETGPAPPAVMANQHVLVIDDNEANRRMLTTRLTALTMRAAAADSGQAGLDALADARRRGVPFSIALVDANMPAMDGFTVAAEIQRRPELCGATIMMLSSDVESDIRRCRQLGTDAHLTKPVKGPELCDAVGRALAVAQARARRLAAMRGPTDARPALVSRSPVERATHAMRVLVAEDNVVNQRVVTGLLSKRGHTVTIVSNGREALEALERETFDVVLMDVQMPVMSGFEATTAIREGERLTGRHHRIVAMTARAMNGDRERCTAAGMDGYLAKPLEARMLFSVVESGAAPPPERPGPVFDHPTLKERLGGDEQLESEVIRLFLDDCPNRLAAIKAAVDAGDADEIRQAAHALKGAAGNLAATGLFQAAETLERLGAEHRMDAAIACWKRLSVEATNVLDALRRFETSRDAHVIPGGTM